MITRASIHRYDLVSDKAVSLFIRCLNSYVYGSQCSLLGLVFIVEMLLDKEADLSIANTDGDTALHQACKSVSVNGGF